MVQFSCRTEDNKAADSQMCMFSNWDLVEPGAEGQNRSEVLTRQQHLSQPELGAESLTHSDDVWAGSDGEGQFLRPF